MRSGQKYSEEGVRLQKKCAILDKKRYEIGQQIFFKKGAKWDKKDW